LRCSPPRCSAGAISAITRSFSAACHSASKSVARPPRLSFENAFRRVQRFLPAGLRSSALSLLLYRVLRSFVANAYRRVGAAFCALPPGAILSWFVLVLLRFLAFGRGQRSVYLFAILRDRFCWLRGCNVADSVAAMCGQ